MSLHLERARRAVGVALAAMALAGCDLDVSNPQVIDADTFDPTEDAATLSLSAQTDLYGAFGAAVVRGAYFAGEAWVGAVRQETNDFGRRVIVSANLDINPTLWAPLSAAVASNEKVLEVLAGRSGPGVDLHVARSALNAGFALTLMAEHMCGGVMLQGPLMSTDETLDSAIARFERAITAGQAAGGAEAAKIVSAARVGAGRAHLQKGEHDLALLAVAGVAPEFAHHAVQVDDAGNRGRAGNPVYAATAGRTFVVPAVYRALGDPRVPSETTGAKAQDGQLDLVVQAKYPDYGADLRISSGLEARYIEAEARLRLGDAPAALALIGERRAAGEQGAFNGTTADEILAELMDQRARDFWLEGKAMGDFRRNPGAAPYVPAPGTPFYKPTQGEFGDLTCIPIPKEELDTNPNLG